ncbi:MAG TPA: CBS domain-containing protein [Candidatus Dormibacteraeota bacterium]|nr:CBS domain-containing protein [Candidatus Dormibacteraeota bacterium]
MKPAAVVLGVQARLPQAAARMRAGGTSVAAVLDEGRLLGVVTERDLVRALADDAIRTATVADYMTAEPCTIGPEADARDAAALMVSRQVRHLPVVEGDAVLGFVSARDLLDLSRRRPVDLERLGYEPW